MQQYDIAVIGGGAAGSMAAIRAGQFKKTVALFERNASIGRKILVTGNGRCNLTSAIDISEFLEKFGKEGEFLRTAFSVFNNDDLIEFFRLRGLEFKIEDRSKFYPVTDNAISVVDVLSKSLKESGVDLFLATRIAKIGRSTDGFTIIDDQGRKFSAGKIVIATGGASYARTGSTGDGYEFAKELGHRITTLHPGLVPLRAKEEWVKELQGLSLQNVRLTVLSHKKKFTSRRGDIMVTHFGVSGPLVLDMSGQIVALLSDEEEIELSIDLEPDFTQSDIDKTLLAEIKVHGGQELKNFLKEYLAERMIPIFARLAGVDSEKKMNQLTQSDRRSLILLFKAFPITVTGSLPLEQAMVTCGGIALKDINPRTLESRLVPGLYFAGEIIDLAAVSGGFNLQEAFSTGYLAAEEAGK